MSILNKLACIQGIRNDVPNQELAKELAFQKNSDDIGELVRNLSNKDKNIQSDCIKVLYEIGYLNPAPIAEYLNDFMKLLKSKNNRLVWGAMIALSTIAPLKAKEVFACLDEIFGAMQDGSVITMDNGIKTLAIVASTADEFATEIFPYLIKQLKTCKPREVPQYAEKIAIAVNLQNRNEFLEVLNNRQSDFSASQMTRIKKVVKEVNKKE